MQQCSPGLPLGRRKRKHEMGEGRAGKRLAGVWEPGVFSIAAWGGSPWEGVPALHKN